MSEQDVRDGRVVFDRIGDACNRIAGAGWEPIAAAIASYARDRRGVLRKVHTERYSGHGLFTGQRIAGELFALADSAEKLAARLEADDRLQIIAEPGEDAP